MISYGRGCVLDEMNEREIGAGAGASIEMANSYKNA
jgi:hypothetical protein